MTDRDESGRFQAGHSLPGPGRPSEYDPSMNDQARKLALLGLTDAEIGEFFGVTERTLNNWKAQFPAF
ncbi:helix-turn-helix domain-containing protein [Rhodovulum sulfidophilum]|nr:helix-turn-helix domain-containing protein [Rhodovulum sulfidophilum]